MIPHDCSSFLPEIAAGALGFDSFCDTPYRVCIGCGAHVNIVFFHSIINGVKSACHNGLKFCRDFLNLPIITGLILYPFEIADRYPAGVCQDIRNNQDAFLS